jgi:hypothetical protein
LQTCICSCLFTTTKKKKKRGEKKMFESHIQLGDKMT